MIRNPSSAALRSLAIVGVEQAAEERLATYGESLGFRLGGESDDSFGRQVVRYLVTNALMGPVPVVELAIPDKHAPPGPSPGGHGLRLRCDTGE